MGKHGDTGQELNPVGSNIGEIVEFVCMDPMETIEGFPVELLKEWESEQKKLLKSGKHRKPRQHSKLVTRLLSWFRGMDLLRPVP